MIYFILICNLVSQSSAPSPTSMSEAFSLKQFGFNKALGDPNQLDYTMQDVSSFSTNKNLPAMPVYNNYQMPVKPYVPMQQYEDEGVFKNNPNNPFFGIPSSMDWTEWNEWSQSNQGNTNWQQLV